MEHGLTTSDWVPYPVELVFAFFANPNNLPPLMPRWQRARIEHVDVMATPPRPAPLPGRPRLLSIAAGEGTTMLISFRPFPYSPFRLTWDARVTHFIWNESFCDEQVRGPFASWLHCHSVAVETRSGIEGTNVTDSVSYSLPGGPLGDAMNAIVARNELRKLFQFRQKRLREILPVVARQAGLAQRETA
jgi:ligand-binding SRPBCC domain-containing protein